MKTLLFLLSLALWLPSPCAADVFKYTDKNGGTHYVDSEKKVPEEYREQLSSQSELPTISRVKPAREKLYEKTHYAPPASSRSKNKVELFVTEWCGFCRKLEDYLDEKGIAYTAYDIEKNAKGKRIHAKLGSGVPITRIGDKVIQGYKPDEIESALKSKR